MTTSKKQGMNALKGPEVVCFSSGKGGVGKTSVSVNLAIALVQEGNKVLIIDGDLGLANVDIVLGLNTRHSIREIVEEGAAPGDILEEIIPGLFVLPASSGVPEMANLPYEEQAFLTESVESIINTFDYVLIDTAAGIGESVLWLNNWAKKNVLLLTPDPTSMTDAYALIKVLYNQYDKDNFQLIVNNVASRKEGESIFVSMATVIKNFLGFQPGYLGSVPKDSKVVSAVRKQRPFLLEHSTSKAARAIYRIAALL